MWFDKRFEQPVVKELTPVQKNLLDAANLLETQGWIQGDYRTEKGYCMVGAMREACHCPVGNYEGVYIESVNRMLRYLNRQDVAIWNDWPLRTKEEAIAALRGAAKLP